MRGGSAPVIVGVTQMNQGGIAFGQFQARFKEQLLQRGDGVAGVSAKLEDEERSYGMFRVSISKKPRGVPPEHAARGGERDGRAYMRGLGDFRRRKQASVASKRVSAFSRMSLTSCSEKAGLPGGCERSIDAWACRVRG